MRAELLKEYGNEKEEDKRNSLLNDIDRLSKVIHEKKERLN